MNASELLVECLENEGVRYIFGIPGEGMVLFLDALRKSSIRYITTADERGASFMAGAYGRLTGKPGVVATTLGPGALNIPNGLAFANLSGFPLVALTWQSSLRKGAKDNGYQYVDIRRALAPVTKASFRLTSHLQIPKVVRASFKRALTPKSGACHIEIYEDVSREKIENGLRPLPMRNEGGEAPQPSSLQESAEYIVRAKNPLILAGIRALDNKTGGRLRELVRETGISLVTTPMAQGILPQDSHFNLFSFTNGAREDAQEVMGGADLVLSVGYDPVEYSPSFWNRGIPKTIVRVDTFAGKPHKNFAARVELIGDMASTLSSLKEGLHQAGYRRRNPLKRAGLKYRLPGAYRHLFPMKPQYLVEALRKTAKGAIFVHDNGMHKLWMTRYFHPGSPNTVLVDNTLASMGSGIPQAIAAKIVHPDRKVVVNTGDGGLLMSLGELATAGALNLPLVIVVWNDGGYGMIRWHQEKNGLQEFGVSLANPDYPRLAQSFGGVGFGISKAGDLEPALKEALNQKKLCIIDCPVDYSENIKTFAKGEPVSAEG